MTGAAAYLLVETQAGAGAERFLRDGAALASAGADVSVLLVADGVAAAVRGTAAAAPVAELAAAGGAVWVDGFTLAQRALPHRALADGTTVVGMSAVADRLLAEGTKVVWH